MKNPLVRLSDESRGSSVDRQSEPHGHQTTATQSSVTTQSSSLEQHEQTLSATGKAPSSTGGSETSTASSSSTTAHRDSADDAAPQEKRSSMSVSAQLEVDEEDDLPPTQDMNDDTAVEPARQRSDTLSSQSSVQNETENAATAGRESVQRRLTIRWTREEEDLLVQGVQQYGEGQWAHILEMGRGVFLPHRTNVDLKDKWKNLSKQGIQRLIARANANARRKHRTNARTSKKSSRADADESGDYEDRVPSKKRRPSAPSSELYSSDSADVDHGSSDHDDPSFEQAPSKSVIPTSPERTQVELQIATDTSFPHLLSIVVDPRQLSTVALLKRELNKRFLDHSPLPTNLRLVSLQSRRLLGDLERLEACIARDGHQFYLLYDP